MFKCSCGRMKCDEGSEAWNNLRISHINVFLQNLGQHVPRKKNMEFAKVRRKKFFFGEDDVFQMKEFRTTLICGLCHLGAISGQGEQSAQKRGCTHCGACLYKDLPGPGKLAWTSSWKMFKVQGVTFNLVKG